MAMPIKLVPKTSVSRCSSENTQVVMTTATNMLVEMVSKAMVSGIKERNASQTSRHTPMSEASPKLVTSLLASWVAAAAWKSAPALSISISVSCSANRPNAWVSTDIC